MTKKLVSSLIILMLAVLLCCGLVFAASPEFSADMVMTDAKGKTTTGRVYMKGYEKVRQELKSGDDVSVTILRLDKKVSWTLMPENQYMEIAFNFDPNQPNPDYKYEMKTIGTETVNGYSCQVVEYVYKDKKLGSLVQWIADDLGFAVKTQTKNSRGKVESTIEYKNIVVGPQPDSLFEIPAGYKKFSMFQLPF
jgi:outer membrane lipoprotein-sorting protein